MRGGLGYVGTGASPVTALRPWRAGFCSEVTSEVQEESKGRNRYDYFKLGFIDLIRNPQNHKDLFYDPKDGHLSNKRVAVVFDRKPKAKAHFMILPTTLLQKYSLLNETHIELLEEMRDRAQELIKE